MGSYVADTFHRNTCLSGVVVNMLDTYRALQASVCTSDIGSIPIWGTLIFSLDLSISYSDRLVCGKYILLLACLGG